MVSKNKIKIGSGTIFLTISAVIVSAILIYSFMALDYDKSVDCSHHDNQILKNICEKAGSYENFKMQKTILLSASIIFPMILIVKGLIIDNTKW